MCEIKTREDWARNMVSGCTIVLVMKIVRVCVGGGGRGEEKKRERERSSEEQSSK